jgi:hypothetical protein
LTEASLPIHGELVKHLEEWLQNHIVHNTSDEKGAI